MARETMTPNERLWAAIRLQKPDRVPVVPTMTPESDAGLAGVSMARVSSDNQMALALCLKTFDDYGGWDSIISFPYTPIHRQAIQMYPMKMRIPGRDLPENYIFQLVEDEVMKTEDYDKICDMGINRFYYEDYLWRISDLKPPDLSRILAEVRATAAQLNLELGKRGIPGFIMPTGAMHPFFMLSMMRSLPSFTKDLYFNPEPVERTLKHMTDELISRQIKLAKALGATAASFVDERASGFYYPLSIFERFWWPYTQQIVDAFWSEGIVSIWHLDTCWNKNLPYFQKLPRGSAVLEFDGTTDIFLAKEILRNHLCLYGDVPAALLSLGNTEEVEAYCRKLIDKVGGDGGFILGTGCCVPPNCKTENFRAMIQTGKTYERSKS
ncbi:MAG: hypothetical protein A2Y91_03680 [Chloroflexi bacterium RBG_13_54_8]|nr:MAG: hypothetical protein A2Y91_03680 [Chloroflexi bacterium RBG_13_54_8]